MAKKIFRLHEGGNTGQTGWFRSGVITSENLNTIKTEGKDAATSIPTPFATIDLVKSAFKWVVENGIKGNTAHHKLVSDALDVAQLFYYSQRFSNKIQIIAWNPRDRFSDMIDHGNKIHKKFGETLKLFWEQDSVNTSNKGNEVLYNFEEVNRLYFVVNKDNNGIIGGTSPATLFFASPDARKFAKGLEIVIGDDKLFDDKLASLPERDISFIKYMYTLSKQLVFPHVFPELYAYLETIRINHLTSELTRDVTAIERNDIENYAMCNVLNNENDICEVLGIKLRVHNVDRKSIAEESDFTINSDYFVNGLAPLVLPQYPFSEKWTYTTEGIFWDGNTKIPNKNKDKQEDSKLPVQHDSYHWLTGGNFLAEKIIKLPYPIDDSKFMICGSESYLLPLTETFFTYFKAEKVKQYLTIKEQSGGLLNVELKIPVKRGVITFKKQYSDSDKNIETLNIHLAIFPFLKASEFDLEYNIGIIDDRDTLAELTLICLNDGNQLENIPPIKRSPVQGALSKYYKFNSKFDTIGITSNASTGFIIPLLNKVGGLSSVNFAIDFGTTNTHIEYKYEDLVSVPIDNIPDNPFWQSLINRNKDFKNKKYFVTTEETFEKEIMPYTFANNHEINFPLRTVLVFNKGIDFRNKIEVVRQVNNYLLYDKTIVPKYLETVTQLKWSNYTDPTDEKKVEYYLEFLITLCLYKTLQLGGNPATSTITWFFPVSMGEYELSIFFKLWKEVYERVFKQKSEKRILGIPESVAPYLYYKSHVAGLSLSIDIGGGSSDIAIFDEDDEKAKLISSFKFAGNAIFGDGYPSEEYKNNSDRNGFVATFSNNAKEAVENNEADKKILNSILIERKNSADFSSYLFSLEQKKGSSFSYTKLLQKNKKLKLSILVFYGAIAYYSANLLYKAGIGIPKFILFSGTASKTASILDATENLKNLSELFQVIFETIYGQKASHNLVIRLSAIPKEVTCKGALKAKITDSVNKSPIKFWIGGNKDNIWGNVLDRERDIPLTPHYGELTENQKSELVDSINNYYVILDEYINSISLDSKFMIEKSAYETFKNMRKNNNKEYLIRGIKAYYKENDKRIEETLFFYPLIGMLNNLSFALAENIKTNE